MNINFAGHAFSLHPSGILFWPQYSMAIVSDLHLEKGSHYARRGFFLPPYDTQETLSRLLTALTDLQASRLLILGDTFHDEGGYHRLAASVQNDFNSLCRYEPVWIIGNHDGMFVPPGFNGHQKYILDGITFSHVADEVTSFEISGHYHPKVDIIHKEARISRPCFIEDGNKFILPAFGAYTGGLNVADPSISHILKNPRIYALGQKVYALPRQA